MNSVPSLRQLTDMVSLVLAESSLELVPPELQGHPSVLSHARKLQKNPSEILLDNSWHYAAMNGIPNELKRGRPDLVHVSVLGATSTPLYREARVDIYVHTVGDFVITFGTNVSIPKSYHRFAGLVEKLFKERTIQAGGRTLLRLEQKTFHELVYGLGPSRVIGLSTVGTPKSFEQVASLLDDRACMVIGGFQKGHFSGPVQNKIGQLYSVGDTPYDAHVVVSRLLYEYEKTIFM